MAQSAALDKIETVPRAIEFLVHLTDEDVRSPEDALVEACASLSGWSPRNRGLHHDRQPQPRSYLPNGRLSAPTNVALQQAPRRSDHVALCRDLRTGHM